MKAYVNFKFIRADSLRHAASNVYTLHMDKAAFVYISNIQKVVMFKVVGGGFCHTASITVISTAVW